MVTNPLLTRKDVNNMMHGPNEYHHCSKCGVQIDRCAIEDGSCWYGGSGYGNYCELCRSEALYREIENDPEWN